MCNVSLGQHILYVFLWGIWLKKTNISSLPQIKLAGNPTGTVVYCILVSFAAVLSVGHISLPTNSCLQQQYIPFQLCQPITGLVPKSDTPGFTTTLFSCRNTNRKPISCQQRKIDSYSFHNESNCDNFHHFPLKIELFCQDFESHGAQHQTEVTQQRAFQISFPL